MKRIHFLWTGKPKKSYFHDAAGFYLQRICRFYPVSESVVKDAPSTLAPDERSGRESEAALARLLPSERLICLDERGKSVSSVGLAKLLQGWIEDPALSPAFLVGGAYGLSDEARERAHHLLSFGPMTFPHELARVMLLEQVYRAACILHGHPYHHA